MATAELEAHVRDEAGTPVIELVGEIDRNADAALGAAYADVEHAPRVVLDFTRVTYINSTGIAVIVGLLARARTSGQQLGARGLSAHYRQIFEITRLSDFMTMLDEEGEQ